MKSNSLKSIPFQTCTLQELHNVTTLEDIFKKTNFTTFTDLCLISEKIQFNPGFLSYPRAETY